MRVKGLERLPDLINTVKDFLDCSVGYGGATAETGNPVGRLLELSKGDIVVTWTKIFEVKVV